MDYLIFLSTILRKPLSTFNIYTLAIELLLSVSKTFNQVCWNCHWVKKRFARKISMDIILPLVTPRTSYSSWNPPLPVTKIHVACLLQIFAAGLRQTLILYSKELFIAASMPHICRYDFTMQMKFGANVHMSIYGGFPANMLQDFSEQITIAMTLEIFKYICLCF